MYRLCRVREISPGTHTFFHTYTCPVYCWRSVQLLDFGLFRSLIHASQPVRDFCSSGQCFASGFLQTHTSRRRPCLWLHPSHCRADQGLSPFRTCARRAHEKRTVGPNTSGSTVLKRKVLDYMRSGIINQLIAICLAVLCRRQPLSFVKDTTEIHRILIAQTVSDLGNR